MCAVTRQAEPVREAKQVRKAKEVRKAKQVPEVRQDRLFGAPKFSPSLSASSHKSQRTSADNEKTQPNSPRSSTTTAKTLKSSFNASPNSKRTLTKSSVRGRRRSWREPDAVDLSRLPSEPSSHPRFARAGCRLSLLSLSS